MDDKLGDDEKSELAYVRWEECEGEWLEWDWRNDKRSWFQRQGDAYRNERLVNFRWVDKGATDSGFRTIDSGFFIVKTGTLI